MQREKRVMANRISSFPGRNRLRASTRSRLPYLVADYLPGVISLASDGSLMMSLKSIAGFGVTVFILYSTAALGSMIGIPELRETRGVRRARAAACSSGFRLR